VLQFMRTLCIQHSVCWENLSSSKNITGRTLYQLHESRIFSLFHMITSQCEPGYLFEKLRFGRSQRTGILIPPRHYHTDYGNSFFVGSAGMWNSRFTYVSPKHISPNAFFTESFFTESLFTECIFHRIIFHWKIFHRMLFSPNEFFTERLFHRMHISPNSYFTECIFHRIIFHRMKFSPNHFFHRMHFSPNHFSPNVFFTGGIFTESNFHIDP
jgi:hypothetical protein